MSRVDEGQPFTDCANCGERFERGVTYPVTTFEDADGQLQLASFCDETCMTAWDAGADGD